ncbi:hypothetical protein PVAND_004640 [Polypedilum vanderplanki]|uniref:N-acetylgalactosaminide beta-1,3-galactosyltransferase n=1 Tax=Polypedilum vanderplanki TaxID=319348 RepID=A0A9J6BYB7_POLVA|nr:hypothetical protein PVAND_004640 [Polypedilum vanderplanki]
MSIIAPLKKVQDVFYFLIGFLLGFLLFFLLTQNYHQLIKENFKKKLVPRVTETSVPQITNITSTDLYEHELADQLFNEIKILCWVFTHPDNHKKKVPHVMKTWGRKCNKLLFISTKEDESNPNIIALPVENGRSHLWNKTKLTMKYVYENHLNDVDWFMRADDDNFMIMENLRYLLYQFHPQTALYIGCRFAIHFPKTEEGYMAGGGQIFSKKAIIKFNEISLKNTSYCVPEDSELDDVFVGRCLKDLAIFLDGRDELNQMRFFPIGTEEHMKHEAIDPTFWYSQYLWRNFSQGGLDCCSDTFIESHYASPQEMHMLDYLIYNVHPFGLQKNLTETLPRKLSIEEIIKRSDEKSFAANYQEHRRNHQIDEDEKYRKKK